MTEALSPEVIEGLSPGIRDAVLWFRSYGFNTTDSGDGSNYAAGMEGALPYPMIAIRTTASFLIHDCCLIRSLLYRLGIPSADVVVEGSYNPDDWVAMILVSEPNGTTYLRRLKP